MPDVATAPTTAEEADRLLELGGDEAPTAAPQDPVEAPAEPAPDAAPAIPGQPRDAQGRFASPAPSAEPEPSPPVAPATADAAAPAPETPGEPAEAPETPWSFKAEGGEFTLEGSDTGEDGIFVPATQRDRLETLVRQGLAFEGSAKRWFNDANQRQQALQRDLEAARTASQAAESQTQTVLGHFEQLIAQSAPMITQGVAMQDTPLGQWFMNAAVNWPVLQAEAKAKAVELKADADRKRLQEIESQQQDAQLRPQMQQALSNWVLHYGQTAGLDRPILEQIYADLASGEYDPILFVRAPADDPFNGIRKGELVINHGIVERAVQRMQAVTRTAAPRPAAATGKPGTPATAPGKKVAPPPTVSAAQGPVPRKPLPEPKTREESDRLLLEGGYDLD